MDVSPTPSMACSPEERAAIERIVDRYAGQAGGLIPVLEEVQEAIGYLSKAIQKKIAGLMGIPLAEVHGVVSFYSFFTMVPRGRHTARCCLGTACYVRGGRHNLEELKQVLGIEPGGTTPDRRYSLETVRCLGACALAPVITVDADTFRQVKPAQLPDILSHYP